MNAGGDCTPGAEDDAFAKLKAVASLTGGPAAVQGGWARDAAAIEAFPAGALSGGALGGVVAAIWGTCCIADPGPPG